MRRWTVSLLAIAAFCGVAVTLFAELRAQTDEPMNREEGFTLEIRGAKQYSDAIFNVQYALAHGFNFVDINGARYRRIAKDVVMKEHANEPPGSHYLVIYEVKAGKLIIQDPSSGKELGTYKLHRDGWPGAKAASWLVQKIGPLDPSLADRNLGDRHPQDWTIDVQAPTRQLTPSQIGHPFVPIVDCGSSIVYEPRFQENGFGEIRSKRWTLTRPYGFKGILCSKQGIFIFAGQGQSGFAAQWFSEDGNFNGHHAVHNPVASDIWGATWINHMSVDSGKLRVVQSWYRSIPAPFTAAIAPEGQVQFTISLGALTR